MEIEENIPHPPETPVMHVAVAIYRLLTMIATVWTWIAKNFPGSTDFYLTVFNIITKGSIARWCLGVFGKTP